MTMTFVCRENSLLMFCWCDDCVYMSWWHVYRYKEISGLFSSSYRMHDSRIGKAYVSLGLF